MAVIRSPTTYAFLAFGFRYLLLAETQRGQTVLAVHLLVISGDKTPLIYNETLTSLSS